MKRFILIFILVIIQLSGSITSKAANEAALNTCNKNELSSQNSHSSDNQTHFWDSVSFQISNEGNILSNTGFNLHEAPTRIDTSTERTARVRNFKLLVYQKLFNRLKINLFRQACNQIDGYYLYHLRKLLI